MKIDFDGINAAALARLPAMLAEWFPAATWKGVECILGDLSGAPGRSLSINSRTGKWADFSGGARGGDPISLFAAMHHAGDRVEAARDLGKRLGIGPGTDAARVAPAVERRAPEPSEWEPLAYSGDTDPDVSRWTHAYRYADAAGRLIGFVLRTDKPDGSRDKVVPFNYGRLKGELGWHFRHLATPRPLYGMDRLAARPDAAVIVCEGEKAADACAALFPDHVAMTWQAGTGNVKNADWSPLASRRVIVWPDADVPGYFAAAEILRALPSAQCLDVIGDDDGADAADLRVSDPDDWLADRTRDREHVMQSVISMIAGGYGSSKKKEGPLPAREWFASADDVEPEREQPPDDYYGDTSDEPDAPVIEKAASPIAQKQAERIVPLGHDRSVFHYLSTATGQIHQIKGEAHTRGHLTAMASEAHYWQRSRFMGKDGVSWTQAADGLMTECRAVGIYDPDRVRGRGAWLDNDRSVLHVGDKTVVDGVASPLIVEGSEFVYEQSARLRVDIGDALTTAEAKGLLDVCVAAPWEAPEHMGRLLAGWCVIAPVCGAMPWRPHLWITSEPGGGKSWVLDNILKPSIGPLALEVQSKTTEAGIRQTLGCDARPVIFDEAETQNERDRDRVQLVLDLARQASNEGGAAIIKGSASGRASNFRIRSCFVFSSINVGMSQAADESRTVVLTLSPDRDEKARSKAFKKLQALHAATFTPGFSGRLLARTLSLLPVIRANSVIFAEAIARSGQSRRTGDTFGVLLAGAWSLRSRAEAKPEEADRFVAETAWVREAVVKAGADPEWRRAISTLTQHRTRIGQQEVPVGELIQTCITGTEEGGVSVQAAKIELDRMGIRIKQMGDGANHLLIANHSAACERAFARSAWAVGWHKTIARAPGARQNATTVRFGGGVSKVLAVPMSVVFGEGG